MNKHIKVYEHSYIKVKDPSEDWEGKQYITPTQFIALEKYHESISDKFFSISRKKIKFNHHVGVLQVGKLIIEVLPKIDREDDNEDKWHNALVQILCYTKNIRAKSSTLSDLSIKKYNGSTCLTVGTGLNHSKS